MEFTVTNESSRNSPSAAASDVGGTSYWDELVGFLLSLFFTPLLVGR